MSKEETNQDDQTPSAETKPDQVLSANQQHQQLESYQQQQQQPYSQQIYQQQQQHIQNQSPNNNNNVLTRKLPPLSTVYRADYKPFSTFLPYEPAFRDQPSQQQQQPLSNQVLTTEYPLPNKNSNVAALALNTSQPSLDSSITKFKSSTKATTKKNSQPETTTKSTSSTTTDKVTKPKKKDPLRPYACTTELCNWSFARQSDLTRHMKSHSAPQYHCPYWKNDPTCHKNNGAFNRLDVLKRHLKLVHYVKDKFVGYNGGDNTESKEIKNKEETKGKKKDEPGWCRSCQKMFPNAKAFVEHCYECAANTQPAEWRDKNNNDLTIVNIRQPYNKIKSNNNAANVGQSTFRVLIGPQPEEKIDYAISQIPKYQ
ncbi:hypothetical protein KGF54_003841 [Candida jiufengensis]|uniref:uncharacterized protein n=1 Tax=Candida jiufengensis TaxID=497108 RepID=UPI002223F0F4|nr:uncharacterized protein KGF54_003841 [Candida jiufengensis]KAI5950767.1 hypothetical protein KGF54_003841 [Candida jiufengensis]